MSALNKCITSVATTGLFFERGHFWVAGLSFKALPLCVPLYLLAHFIASEKFWKSAVWRSAIPRLLLKIGRWLTLERLLHTHTHTHNFVYELRAYNFYGVYFMGGEFDFWICFAKTSDICRTSVRPGINAQAWVARASQSSHTRPLYDIRASWLARIFLLIPQLFSSCVAVSLFTNIRSPDKLYLLQKATESESKIFIWHNCMKRNCKTGLFIYYWFLLTSYA